MCQTQAQLNNNLIFYYQNILGNNSEYAITPAALLNPTQIKLQVDITDLPNDLILNGDQYLYHVINPFETVIIFVYLEKMLDRSDGLKESSDDYLTWEEVEAMENEEFEEVDIRPCDEEDCGPDEEEEEEYIEEGENLRHEYN